MGNGYIIPAISTVLNAWRGDQNQKRLLNPLPSWGLEMGNGHITLAFSVPPMLNAGIMIRSGYLTPSILGATNGQWLHNPYLLKGPQRLAQGTN